MTTKKTMAKKNSAAKRIIPAAGMLAVSAMMLATSTYAWFTMNKTVEVTGMEVRTKVGDNLLICTTNLDADYSANTLVQTRRALLEPASSINGTTGSFYYTTDAKANGAKNIAATTDPYVLYKENGSGSVANEIAGKNSYDTDFNTAYGLGTFDASSISMTSNNSGSGAQDGAGYAYVDYVFYVKGTSNKAGQGIVMSQCDLDYNLNALLNASGSSGTVGDNVDCAWRVAVFAYDVTSASAGKGRYTTTDIAGNANNQVGLLKFERAAYFGGSGTGAGVAVANPSGTGNVVNNATTNNGVLIGTIGSDSTLNETKYFKVVVRLWLEGEDTTCNSKTYAALKDNYTLDMKFDLVDSADIASTAVDCITTNSFNANTAHTQSGSQYDSGTGID